MVEALDRPLVPALLPPAIKRCHELIVEEMMLKVDGIDFVDPVAKKSLGFMNADPYFSQRDFIPKIVSVKCALNSDELAEKLRRNRTGLVLEFLEFTKVHRFDGVEINCDHVLRPSITTNFARFLDDLNSAMMKVLNSSCARVSVRIPADRVELNKIYDTNTLNRLRHVSLGPPSPKTQRTRPNFPLFKAGPTGVGAADSLRFWMMRLLKSRRVILLLPTYALAYKIKEKELKGKIENLQTAGNHTVLSRSNLCNITASHSTTTTALTDNGYWLTFESKEAIVQKIEYARRKNLGGVGVLSLNMDDFPGLCPQKKEFPVLSLIRHAAMKKGR